VSKQVRQLLFRLGFLATLALVGMAGLLLFDNNSSLRPMKRAEFLRNLDAAISGSRGWILNVSGDEATALVQNPALLHMVVDCARISGDQRLQFIATDYFHSVQNPYWWGRMVDPSSRFERPPDHYLRTLVNYQRWFIHAVAPQDYRLSAEDYDDMFSPDKYRTGRATHQLFALYLYRSCNGASPDLNRLIDRISARIASEASIDFRVTDLYLQRVAFLLAAGHPDLVKHRWVERAFAAQQWDGGWLYSWHGWSSNPLQFRLQEATSASHPTAQGMWIAYMLKYRYPQWMEKNYSP
jgi:hypothetical protein